MGRGTACAHPSGDLGAPDRNRTRDIFFTREALYQLSYWGVSASARDQRNGSDEARASENGFAVAHDGNFVLSFAEETGLADAINLLLLARAHRRFSREHE